MPSTPNPLRSLVAVMLLAAPALAQCDPTWDTANPPPQLNGSVLCSTLWDPDGAGPQAVQLVVGGSGLNGGLLTAVSTIGVWDGQRWSGLGNGPVTGPTSGQVNALVVWNGQLVAGGSFGGGLGGSINYLARWDGSTWQQLGTLLPGAVQHLTVWNGNLVASVSSVIRMWNGTTWIPLPAPPSVSAPTSMAVFQGQLYVGGHGTTSQGAVDRWNGTSWGPSVLAFGSSLVSGQIRLAVRGSIAIGGTETLYVGGGFAIFDGVPLRGLVSTTNGSTWSLVGGNTLVGCKSLHARPNGLSGYTILASFDDGITSVTNRYSTASPTWTPIGPLRLALTFFGGSYYGTTLANAWQRYDGTSWVPVIGAGVTGDVRAIVPSGNDVIVGGAFQSTTGTALERIARWDGSTFQPLGTGITGNSVDALCRTANGDIVASGSFTAAGGIPASNIARWNGSTWNPLGSGTNQAVRAVCELPNGDIVAAGSFTMAGGVACNRIARWNGSAWSPLNFGMNGTVLAVAVRGDGTLFAAGSFTASGATPCNRIAQWNGTSWQGLGSGCNADVHALAFRPNGELVAVGAFTDAGGVAASRCAVWNGAAWSPVGFASNDLAPARGVCVLPDGDIVLGRGFQTSGTPPDAGISRWNGTTWSGFGSGLQATTVGGSVDVTAIAQRADGTLVVGGGFGTAGGIPALGLATLSPTCRPTVTTYGTGCSSGAGPIVVSADALPWIGSTFRTTTTGVAANSLCLGAIGFAQQNIPLAAMLPEGQPGCSLLAAVDIPLVLGTGPGGTAQSQFALPDSTALVGASFVQQTIPLEFNGGVLTAVRASNGLSMTIGML